MANFVKHVLVNGVLLQNLIKESMLAIIRMILCLRKQIGSLFGVTEQMFASGAEWLVQSFQCVHERGDGFFILD